MSGKGSKPRPTDKKVFDTNFDEIVWKPDITKEPQIVKVKGKKVKRFVY